MKNIFVFLIYQIYQLHLVRQNKAALISHLECIFYSNICLIYGCAIQKKKTDVHIGLTFYDSLTYVNDEAAKREIANLA